MMIMRMIPTRPLNTTMTRIKSTEWAVREALRKKKNLVKKVFSLFDHKVCAICGDALVRERIWRVYVGNAYKYVCKHDASTWEEAYDKACDPNNKGVTYTSSY